MKKKTKKKIPAARDVSRLEPLLLLLSPLRWPGVVVVVVRRETAHIAVSTC